MHNLIWLALIIGIYLALRKKKKKPEPEPKPPPPPRPKLPWEKGEPCLIHFSSPMTRDGSRKGFNLDVGTIADRGFTGWRAQCNAPRELWEMGPVPEWKNVPHDWTDQVGPYKKDGKVFLLDHYNEEWFAVQRVRAEECLKHGIAFFHSAFDGCGTKSANNNAYAHARWNNRGWDGGSEDKFFNVDGPFFAAQKELSGKIIRNIGDLPNVVIELANEPFGDVRRMRDWHLQMIAHMAGIKGELGYDHLKFQINARWAEFNGACEFVAVHTHNDSLGLWDSIRQVNPAGFGDLPGKSGRSSDTGSWLTTDPGWWVEHWKWALFRKHNCEFLVMRNHYDVYAAIAEYQRTR